MPQAIHARDDFETLSEPEISIAGNPASKSPVRDGGLVGERFGKYLIVGELAVGGMAEVFLGVQRGLEGFTKVVVLKRVLPGYSSQPDFVRMFIDEARLAARLEHPNIVRTHEFGEVGGQYFTAMEYLPGEDLAKILNRLIVSERELPIHVAAAIMTRVCAGLHFAHEMTDTAGEPLGLVHRDVNPANIVVTYGGEVKLIDFGVAKTSETHTQTGTIKGKIAYMAPEQLLARGVDRRSDVFSAGVVLWELLTRRPLFARDHEGATLYAIMNDPIPPPSRYRPAIPRELDAIVMRALSRSSDERFDTAEDMAVALETFLSWQDKCDARTLGTLVEELFGSTRAEAKRAISQTRSLGHNVSLVMKLRSEVRSDLAERLDSVVADGLADGSDMTKPRLAAPVVEATRGGGIMYALALVLVAALGGGAWYLTRSQPSAAAPRMAPAAPAALVVETVPAGASITLGGEPTGLHTPATLTGVTGKISVGLALSGYKKRVETIDVPANGALTKRFELETE
jgi:serine/threonine-protein kinase